MRTSWFCWKQMNGKYWNQHFLKFQIFFLVQQYQYIKVWWMEWLVGLWDGAHRWNIRNNFWPFIISFLIYQKLISEFSEHYFCNTINCNFAGSATSRRRVGWRYCKMSHRRWCSEFSVINSELRTQVMFRVLMERINIVCLLPWLRATHVPRENQLDFVMAGNDRKQWEVGCCPGWRYLHLHNLKTYPDAGARGADGSKWFRNACIHRWWSDLWLAWGKEKPEKKVNNGMECMLSIHWLCHPLSAVPKWKRLCHTRFHWVSQ